MDPKMDTGFLQPGETFEDKYDVTRGLLPEGCLWIMDQILGLEVSFSKAERTKLHAKYCVTDGVAHGTPVIPNSVYEHVY